MTPTELKIQGQKWLEEKYPNYSSKPGRERRVLAAAWLCDAVKPRERTGANDGPIVEAMDHSTVTNAYRRCALMRGPNAEAVRVGKRERAA